MSKDLEQLARKRFLEMYDTWWYEDISEFQDDNVLTNEEMDQVLEYGCIFAKRI